MKKKVLLITIVGILLAGGVTASVFLFPYEPSNPSQANDTESTKEGVQAVVNANNEFAFDLYSRLSTSEDENIFYSPYSISAALAMTYEGARGQTADEMTSVLHFPEINTLRSNFAAIYNNLNKKEKSYTLSTGNALWAQKDYSFLEEYFSTVEQYYGGRAVNLDFVNETEKSRQTINTFIEAQTNNKIKGLIPKGVLDAATKLVLTNAIHFKGTWVWEFDKSDTRDRDFHITPEKTIRIPMMVMENDEAMFNYADLEKLQILELPYKGREISMLVLLPKDNLNTIETSLTAEKLKEWRSQMQEEKLDVIYFPKFEFETKYFMKKILGAMGMPTAFTPSADFSGMDGTRNLFIDKVIHQAFVKIDEEGTEAAAATAVIMVEKSAIAKRKVFSADHPFIFLIQERETGNILFFGKVMDPTRG